MKKFFKNVFAKTVEGLKKVRKYFITVIGVYSVIVIITFLMELFGIDNFTENWTELLSVGSFLLFLPFILILSWPVLSNTNLIKEGEYNFIKIISVFVIGNIWIIFNLIIHKIVSIIWVFKYFNFNKIIDSEIFNINITGSLFEILFSFFFVSLIIFYLLIMKKNEYLYNIFSLISIIMIVLIFGFISFKFLGVSYKGGFGLHLLSFILFLAFSGGNYFILNKRLNKS